MRMFQIFLLVVCVCLISVGCKQLTIQDNNTSKSLSEGMDSISASIVDEQTLEYDATSVFIEESEPEDTITYILIADHRYDLIKGIKPPKIKVAGHWGKEIITGNFTGNGNDTIWLEEYEYEDHKIMHIMYKAKSNMIDFPEIEMCWRYSGSAYIINEGDLDGDGKDEWGCMIGTHASGATLEYHVVRYNDKGYWEELVDEDNNPYEFSGEERHSGIDFFSKGPKKGTITISRLCWPKEPSDEMQEYKEIIWSPKWEKESFLFF